MDKNKNDQKIKWKREISAGGVVYKKENNSVFILLINPKSRNYGPPEDYWTFPKGKIDPGEEKTTTAVREVREESGVNAQIQKEIGHVKYFRNWPGDEALKFVTYYLMKYIDGQPADHEKETAQAKWFKLEEVDSKLKFNTDKEIFEKSKPIIASCTILPN